MKPHSNFIGMTDAALDAMERQGVSPEHLEMYLTLKRNAALPHRCRLKVWKKDGSMEYRYNIPYDRENCPCKFGMSEPVTIGQPCDE